MYCELRMVDIIKQSDGCNQVATVKSHTRSAPTQRQRPASVAMSRGEGLFLGGGWWSYNVEAAWQLPWARFIAGLQWGDWERRAFPAAVSGPRQYLVNRHFPD